LQLETRAGVEHDVEHTVHVVDAAAVERHDVEDLGHEARAVVTARHGRGIRPGGGREVGEIRADQRERGGIVVGRVVDQAARHGDARPAEVLLGDLLTRRLEHHRRSGGVKIDACRLITAKSEIGATSAP